MDVNPFQRCHKDSSGRGPTKWQGEHADVRCAKKAPRLDEEDPYREMLLTKSELETVPIPRRYEFKCLIDEEKEDVLVHAPSP